MNKDSSDVFTKGFLALGILAAAGLVGYALTYLLVMPKVSPDGFVPTTLEIRAGVPAYFGTLQAAFILLYAFAFLPVNILFTAQKYRTSPYAVVFASCLIGISSLLEMINNLPLIAVGIYPGKLAEVSADVLLRLRQVETLRYLAYDVAGFTLLYAALGVYALIYLKSRRSLSFSIIGSIVLFIANVPCLWYAPNLAVILMALSILAMAPVPVFLARMAVE
jgi:hypothetical protein